MSKKMWQNDSGVGYPVMCFGAVAEPLGRTVDRPVTATNLYVAGAVTTVRRTRPSPTATATGMGDCVAVRGASVAASCWGDRSTRLAFLVSLLSL